MLEVKNLNVSFNGKKILKSLNFKLKAGDITAVVGESGTGKTTLAMSIMGLISEQFSNAKVSGNIFFNGIDICTADRNQLQQLRWKRISMVFQNVDNILNPTLSINYQISEIMPGKNNDLKIKNILARVGFPPERAVAYPHQLSMGEKQKVLLAMAYILEPELVILDEPTSSLDHHTRNNLIDIIKKMSSGRAVLILTHDLDTVRKLTKKTIMLYGGSIIEAGDTEAIFSNPHHPYTRGLLRSFPSTDRTKDLQGIRGKPEFVEEGCPFHPRCTQSVNICRIQKPPLDEYEDRMLSCHRGGIIPLLEVKDVSKSYNGLNVLKSVSLNIYEGETVTLLGRSGSGKTTLAKIIMGLLKADSGEIYLETRQVNKWDFSFYSRVQMIFQEVASAISHRLNVFEAVTEPLVIQKITERKILEEEAKKVLSEVQLPADHDFLRLYPHHLSGGELQRIVIARALILSPGLLIADEPTSSLDASIQAKILKLLNNIQEERGLGMLFITHDLGVARKVSDKILKLDNGIITEERIK